MVTYFVRHENLFRKDGSSEARYDANAGEWVDIRPAISDWIFGLETDIEEINEEQAREIAPSAFV